MGRKRKEDGLKPTIVKRGDKSYAYEVTSRIENGVKRNYKRYLGVYDATTGKILEKNENRCAEHKKLASMEREIRIIDNIVIGEYGGVYLLDEIQKSIGLGLDLFRAFGTISKLILASAMALNLGHPRVYSIENTMDVTWLRRYYGIESKMDSAWMTDFTERIGHSQANMDMLFSFRMEKCSDVVCWDTTTHGAYTNVEGLAEYLSVNKDNEKIEQFKVGLATDIRGIPVLFRVYPGSLADTQTIHRLFDDMDEFGVSNAIATFDRGFLSGKNCKDIIDRKRKFVMPGKTDYKVFKTMLSEFKNVKKKDMRFNDHIYSVAEYEIGLCSAVGRTSVDGSTAYDFTMPKDKGHGKDGLLKAYVCFDTESYNDQIQTHKKKIADLIEKAGKIDSAHPVDDFMDMAGKASKFFDAKADGRNVTVEVKNNAESFFANRAGMFILVTTTDVGWTEAMSAYEVRRLTEQAIDQSKGEDRRFRTSNKDRLMGRMLLRFVSIILKTEIAARIREAKMEHGLDVNTCLDIMNTILAKKYNSTYRLSEITKKARTVCETLRIRIPKDIRENEEICNFDELP